jgi:DNA polymerase-1
MAERPDPANTVYLVDGSNNLYRAFYAIRGLSTSKGLPTNAVYGFTSMLRKLLREHAPRYLGVAFDLSGPTFRHEAFAEYKANRPETPPDLVVQIPYVKKVCQILGVPALELPGFEADDIIATLAARARKAGFQVVVVATDKDLLQLVGDGVLIYHPVRDEFLDSEGVERVFGVKPGQVRDVLALSGDASDNIPGVPGIGEKGARDLIREYGDLESVIRAAEGLKNKRARVGLLEHADTARLSRDLATLRYDAPLEFDPGSLLVGAADQDAARRLFEELEFGALVREYVAPVAPATVKHTVVRDAAALQGVIERLRESGRFAFNLERDHAEPMRATLVGVALAGAGDEGFYVPVAHRSLGAPPQLNMEAVLRLLRPLFEDDALRRSGHNIKSDLVLLRRLGWPPPEVEFDTMLASYLLNASRRSHALETVAQDVAGLAVPGYESVLGSGARSVPLADLDVERAAALVSGRVAAVLAIRERLEADLRSDDLMPLFKDLEMPLAYVLAEMEAAGVRLDTAFLASLSRDWEAQLVRLTSEIHALAGKEFNINSPRQLGEILFDVLKLTPGRKTQKTRSFSTGVETLEELADEHELPRKILEYRSLQKLKSTYVDSLPGLINPGTGRVHTSFNQAVAATGRLSSSDPNLQNIPIRTEQGRQIRRAFVTDPGHVLLSADYSQIELRVLAHLCGDAALVDAFQRGEDIHRRTAAEVFGVMPDLVSDEMRRRAKVVNFGIIYGMGSQRLAREQGIAVKEAEGFIEAYFSRLPKVKEYIDRTIAAVESEGRVKTLLNRVRYFPEVKGTDRNARQQALRAAVNTTIQGSAADLIKLAMVALSRRLKEAGSAARMTLQVHDELVLEVTREEVAPVARIVREVMEGVHPLRVPLVADLKVGPNWLDMTRLQSKD